MDRRSWNHGDNLAEQDIRMAKQQQKISDRWRTDGGANRYLRARAFISTSAQLMATRGPCPAGRLPGMAADAHTRLIASSARSACEYGGSGRIGAF
jgi:hypothetical protein